MDDFSELDNLINDHEPGLDAQSGRSEALVGAYIFVGERARETIRLHAHDAQRLNAMLGMTRRLLQAVHQVSLISAFFGMIIIWLV